MRLIPLGTTGYHPNAARHTACFLFPEHSLLLDAGTGIFRAAPHLRETELTVFLSHAHLDHIIGLTFLFDLFAVSPAERAVVYGEPAKLEAIQQHLFSELLFPILPPLEWRVLPERYELADGGRMTWFPLEHPGGSVGYRIDWPDRSLAYVTDTVANREADYLARIQGVDLLIHECYFRDGQEELALRSGHSWATPVAQVAREAGVGRLLLTHMNPLETGDDPVGIDAMRKIFAATEYAIDEREVEF